MAGQKTCNFSAKRTRSYYFTYSYPLSLSFLIMKRNEVLQKIMPVISAFTVVASTYAALNSSIAGSNDDLLATIVAMEECGRGVQRLRFKTTRFSERGGQVLI